MLWCCTKVRKSELSELQNLPEVRSSLPRQVDEISVGFIRKEDPCIHIKMAAVSFMRRFSRWQFVVLGRKTQVFNAVNQKNNF